MFYLRYFLAFLDFPHPSRLGLVSTRFSKMGTGSIQQVQSGRAMVMHNHPHLAPRLKKE